MQVLEFALSEIKTVNLSNFVLTIIRGVPRVSQVLHLFFVPGCQNYEYGTRYIHVSVSFYIHFWSLGVRNIPLCTW